MTFTAHKLGGPYGIGALLARREVTLTAVQHGGGQERDVRSGTFDVAAAAGFAAALEVAVRDREQEEARIRALRDGPDRRGPRRRRRRGAARHARPGRQPARGDQSRLPGLPVRLAVDAAGRGRHRLLGRLGLLGRGAGAELRAERHGAPTEAARSAVRFSLGHSSTPADVQALAAALPAAVHRARAARRVRLSCGPTWLVGRRAVTNWHVDPSGT